MEYPGVRLCRSAETVGDKRRIGRSEECFDLSVREFLPESRLGLWIEVSSGPPHFGRQLDVPIVQRGKHVRENIEEITIAGLLCDLWSEGCVLKCPVDLSQGEKWVPAMKGLPELFESRFGVTKGHRSATQAAWPSRLGALFPR